MKDPRIEAVKKALQKLKEKRSGNLDSTSRALVKTSGLVLHDPSQKRKHLLKILGLGGAGAAGLGGAGYALSKDDQEQY